MNLENDFENKNALPSDSVDNTANNPLAHKKNIRKKKKHNSAIVAASKYRSPVHAVSSNSFNSTNFDQTGTNVSFREEGDIS